MTTLAIAPKPLRRLFDRLDYAPRPRSGVLAGLLEHWEARRGGAGGGAPPGGPRRASQCSSRPARTPLRGRGA